MPSNALFSSLATRFRGYLPIIVDVETGGFNAQTDALLEIAAVIPDMNEDGDLYIKGKSLLSCHTFSGCQP